MKRLLPLIALILSLSILLCGCDLFGTPDNGEPSENPTVAYEVLNNNVPYFTEDEITDESFEHYSELDSLGRCGVVMACIGPDLMPPEGDERGEINHVTPSGWVQAKYETSLVSGGYLYNRSHLIGWQLTDEDDNERNLITGTRYFNVEGMLPFENMVARYIKETDNHVMYRVTPDFKDNNLVATGITMEAMSVEDNGEGILFCVYVYNYQPGIIINYATGESRLEGSSEAPSTPEQTPDGGEDDTVTPGEGTYVLNVSSMKFHDPDCSGVATMKEENKQIYNGSRQDLIDEGYSPCGTCKP